MKKKLLIAVASTIAVGVIIYLIQKEKKEEQRSFDIADAGFETAHDILYPLKKSRWRRI